MSHPIVGRCEKKKCIFDGCNRDAFARGWCKAHWQSWSRNGAPKELRTWDPLPRFWKRVRKTESCWIWIGASTTGGYGQITVNGKRLLAHRFSYEQHFGPIPDGLQVDHTCCVTACVNPAHLEPVTPMENVQRTILRGRHPGLAKTECIHGHQFTPENTYIKPDGHRACIVCMRSRTRAYEARLHA